MTNRIIDSIDLPHGLRTLDTASLETVCRELRDELIDTVAENGGHFASSLGATEITVALHHVFDTPNDKLLWDVGHQAYIHKMLTGRREKMSTIRKLGGLSGFLKRSESPFDTFGAGHAGTSVSAGVGLRVALDQHDSENFVVPIIGDGSLTAGMAFEALNHAGDLGLRRFIVVVNDNEMSISPNVGALSWLFSRAVTSQAGSLARSTFKGLYRRGYVPELLYKAIDRAEEVTQGFFSGPAMLFEAFGFRYIGPVDGHNVSDLVTALSNAKQQDAPVIIHARTTKGKGYEPAEGDPVTWHGVVPFDRKRGEFLPASSSSAPGKKVMSYTSVFAETVTSLIEKDPKVVAITAAMLGGTGLDKVKEVHPGRVFDVGICEQHAVTFAAGLACEGVVPVCAIYSTFLQRGFDQVVHDVCIQNLPVVFAIDRGGVVGNDGETHQGVFDIGYLRLLPNMVLMSPKDENELRSMLHTAVRHPGPIAVRYPRGNGIGAERAEPEILPIGRAERLREGKDVCLVAFGPVVQQALIAASRLESELGVSVTVINARFAKPLDTELLARELPRHPLVCSIEDHALHGGFGSAILEFLCDSQISLARPLVRFGISDEYVVHGSQAEQHKLFGYDVDGIVGRLKPLIPQRRMVA